MAICRDTGFFALTNMATTPSDRERDLLLAEERTELAVERTREAAERTLMAWIRTSLAMIGFGFGTFKLFELVVRPPHQSAGDTWMVLAMTTGLVAWGSLLLIGAILQYRNTLKRLRKRFGTGDATLPLVLVGAAGMAIFGLVALAHLLVVLL